MKPAARQVGVSTFIKFEQDVVIRAGIKHKAFLALFLLQTTIKKTNLIVNDLASTVIDTHISSCTKMYLEINRRH